MAKNEHMAALGRKGGLASGKSRSRSGGIKEIARSVLEAKFLPKGKLSESLKSIGIHVEKPMELESAICAVMGGLALTGNTKAAEFLMDLAELTPRSKLTSYRLKLMERMMNAPDAVEVDASGAIPMPDKLSEIRRQAEELGVYESAN